MATDGFSEKLRPGVETGPLKPPQRPVAEGWSDRIARAKRAREEGRKAREGKPMVFTFPDTLP